MYEESLEHWDGVQQNGSTGVVFAPEDVSRISSGIVPFFKGESGASAAIRFLEHLYKSLGGHLQGSACV
jgi:hypothetical protein